MRAFRALAALFALTPFAASGVIVVTGDSTALQLAVDNAADGDILLIQPGSAGPLSELNIDGKSLTLVVDGGAYDVGQLIVRNLAAGGQVTLHGLTFSNTAPNFNHYWEERAAVEVRDCAGSVWLDACTLAPPGQPPGAFNSSSPAVGGLFVIGSQDVLVTDGSVTGGTGAYENCQSPPGYAPASKGGDAVRVLSGRLVLQGVTALGGTGGGAGGGICGTGGGKPGGVALRLLGSSHALAIDSSLHGANDTPLSGGPGSGVFIELSTSSLIRRGGSIVQGTGAPAVPAIAAPSGTVTSWPTTPRGLSITSPLRVGGAGTLTIDGVAGETVAVFESATGAWLEQPGKQGVFVLGSPLLGPVFALVNPSGTLAVPFTTPPVLPAGVDGMTVLLQLMVKLGPLVTIEDVASCTVLDAGL